MEAKEALETSQNSQNDISTSPPTQDSQAGMKSNETMDRKAVKEPTVSVQSSTATNTAHLADGKALDSEKVTAAAPSDEKSDDNKTTQNAAHDRKDKTQPDADNPAADAGNDQDTVENAQQLLHDSAASTNGPKPVDTSASKPAAAKPLTVDTKSPATPAPFASTESSDSTTSQPNTKPPAAPLSVPTAAKASVHNTTPFQSEMKPAAPDADAPVDKSPFAAPLSVPASMTTPNPAPQMQQMVTRGFGPSPEDELARLRAPLVEMYGSYIYATDTSLSDARQRLRIALEQTRQLREAFTDRVYDKYRIILRPVPKSLDKIVDPIIADPIGAHRKLYERMQDISEEKALEKKEGQRLAAAKPPVGLDGIPLPNAAASAAETAEQIQFLTAGLSLVILPEEEVDERQLELSRYKYRGPINPETGQKVAGLSAATAAAAESMLDRVRKGAALRIDRQRRRQLQLLSGETMETDTAYTSSMHLLSAGGAVRQVQKKAAKGQPGSKMRLPYPSSGGIKTSRSRISAALSESNLLTLNPTSEELKPEGKRSAATAALVANGVGLQRTIQQRWQHPHPESVGGRHALSVATGQKLPKYEPRSLPPLPLLNIKRKPVKVLNDPCPGTARARKAVHSVLEQFVDTKELLAAAESMGPEASESNKQTEISGKEETMPADGAAVSCDSQNKRRRRGATEIGLRRSLQYAPEQGAKRPAETAVSKTGNGKKQEEADTSVKTAEGEEVTVSASPEEPPLQLALAFSVMHALGLVRESAREKKNSFRSLSSLLDFTALADKASSIETSSGDERKTTETESAMQVLSKKILSRKRSFSYAFLSNTVRDASGDVSRDEVIVAEKREETAPVEENAKKKSRRGPQDEEREGETEDEAESNECPILSIRGGGDDIQDELDDQMRPQKGKKRTRSSSRGSWTGSDPPRKSKSPDSSASQPRVESPMSPSAHEAPLHSQAMLAELNQHPLTVLQSRRPASASDPLYAGYSSRGSASPLTGDRSAALRRQHASIHGTPPRSVQLAHGGYGMSRFPSPPRRHVAGDIAADYYGLHHGSAPGYGAHADWSSMGVGGAPSASTSGYLQPIGLAGHRAAMVEMSVRERARALLAREQQQHAAVAAHAAAAQRHANITELSQAAALMSASSGHGAPDFYGHSAGATNRYTNLSRAQSAPAPLYHGGLDAPTTSMRKKRKSSSSSSPSCSSSKVQGRNNDGTDATDANPSFRKNSNPGETDEDAPRGKPKANGEMSESESDKCNAEVKAGALDRNLGNPHEDTPSPVEHDFLPPPTKPKTNSTPRLAGGDGPSPMPMTTSGMQFIVPVAPSGMPSSIRDLILGGCFYSAIDDETSPVDERALVEYLLAVGTAVPIPKAIISNPLKEKLNTPGFKGQSKESAPPIPREVVIAVILVWLWAQHKESFQRAFVKSGRIDVDPECKWLIQIAVEAAVRALMLDIADTVARGGSMAMAFSGGRKGTSNGLKSESHTSTKDGDRQGSSSASVEVHVARIVSQGLMGEFCIDDSVDAALPCFHDLVEYLDEARNCALRTKSRERALLAALIARSATMSEQFSHAYTSAMVRAGLALGHEDLFEHVQDSDLMTSTMLPYDIYSDESGAWEDSCRPEDDFTANLKGNELFGRAHARAMIQKSLWTLQDRLNITGGTPAPGPYTDEPPDASVDVTMKPSVQRTPSSSSLRRRSSFSIASESSFDQTSGTAVATSSALYNPRHYSAPLFFDADDIENKPYGKHVKGYRQRSFSFKTSPSFSGSADESDSRGSSRKRQKLIRTNSISISPRRIEDENASLPRSTEEIDWVDVAEIFQPVALGPSTPTSRQGDEDGGTSDKTTIIAPYCREVPTPPASDDEGDDEEEDISDESILARHRVVLDRMKVKIDKVMEARKQAQKQQGFQRGANPRGRGRGRGRGR